MKAKKLLYVYKFSRLMVLLFLLLPDERSIIQVKFGKENVL